MSRNVETVKTAYACFGRGDVPGILALLAGDVEWEYEWGGEPLKWFKPRRGPADVAGFFQSLADFDITRFEPFAFLEGGDTVAGLVRLVKATGRKVKDLEVHLFTFTADGKVKSFRHVIDTRQLALAAGV
jgi:ketosteroid isomerase-like protein